VRASGQNKPSEGAEKVRRGKILVVAMVLSFCAPVLGSVGLAHAGPATDVVKAKQATLFELLQKSTPANQAKISATFDEMLDYAAVTEASLGSEWASRTDAEKAEFGEVLKQLVRNSYERNLKKTLGYNIEYVAEEPAGGAMVVKTRATSKANAREQPVTIDYKLAQKNGAWRVQDIITEDVSLVSSYRSQFTKIVKKDGFPALIKKMKEKLAKNQT
jgi:phospholipid transport system substrate-binding protein